MFQQSDQQLVIDNPPHYEEVSRMPKPQEGFFFKKEDFVNKYFQKQIFIVFRASAVIFNAFSESHLSTTRNHKCTERADCGA